MEIGDIDHTNPHTDEPFVETFRRGQVVASDGGERDAVDPEGVDPEDAEAGTMEDVVHEAPTDGANRTFERGKKDRDETV